MGWLNLFKKKSSPSNADQNRAKTSVSNEEPTEISFRASSLGIDSERLHQVIDRIVSEDPFFKAYNGKSDDEIKRMNRPCYEYVDVTTMTISFDDRKLFVEGSEIGTLPDAIYQQIQANSLSQITAYAYVIGGSYKVYKDEELHVLSEPLDLEIFLQIAPT